MVIVAVDPGTGVKSACGVAVLEKKGDEIKLLDLKDIWPALKTYKEPMMRLRSIAEQLGEYMNYWEQRTPGGIKVAVESFVMRGRSGQTLQRFIGAVLTRVPTQHTEIIEVQNTSMKKFVGGTGKADKELVLKKVLIKFPNNQKLILAGVRQEYDSIDAVGIGLTALERVK